MSNSELYSLLGLSLEKCIRRFHFPALDIYIFSSKDYSNLRKQLSKIPASDQKLGQLIIKLLLKGKVEEIKTLEETLILSVQFEHKKELYVAELKLENNQWDFLSIHYAGEAPPRKQVGIWGGIAVVALSILLFIALFFIQYFQNEQETANQLTEAKSDAEAGSTEVNPSSFTQDEARLKTKQEKEEELPLEELEEMARKMDMVLINEEEYQKLLDEKEARQKAKEKVDKPYVEITVQYGMAAQQVAKLLVESDVEVAQDVEELTNFFIEQNIQYRIRTGTHQIPVDASYMDIVKILTSRK